MHLLAAQPGGFVDDEGIIDLDQTPAEIIILSAADSSLAALSAGTSAFAVHSRVPDVRLANWMQLLKPAAYDLYEHKVLDNARVVVLSLLGGQNYWQYGFERLQVWAQGTTDGNPRTLIIVPGDDAADPELFAASTVSEAACHRVWRYLREGGIDNSEQLLRFVASEYLSCDLAWREPRGLPRCMLYKPALWESEQGEQGGQASFSEWQQRWQQNGHDQNPVVALLFYRSHLQSANTAMFDGLIAELEQQNLNPLPIAIASLKDAESITLVNALLEQSDASLIINTTGFASNTVASPDLASQPTDFDSPFSKPVPVLQLVLSSSTEDDWLQYSQGLRSRDIAMQVV
ncbi:cobaltochelatase subunit CobN, partial [Pontibacterium sp.]|uniref:cobaltochelatase subunit CobN n=1 Tax=Pontibacterium sp. TaxID=2036026 RepID=UPI003516299A